MTVLLAWADAVDIGWGRGRLAAEPAASLARIDGYVRAHWGRPLDINEAWRSPEDADKNYRAYQAYLNGGPWAPIGLPASQSIHCRGYAIDTDDSWLTWLLNDHGWFHTVYRNGRLEEPWHYEYFAARDNHRNEPAGGNATPFPTPTPELPLPTIEGQVMATAVVYTKDTNDEKRRGALMDTVSGFWSEFSWFSPADAQAIADGFKVGCVGVTSSTLQMFANSAATIRAKG